MFFFFFLPHGGNIQWREIELTWTWVFSSDRYSFHRQIKAIVFPGSKWSEREVMCKSETLLPDWRIGLVAWWRRYVVIWREPTKELLKKRAFIDLFSVADLRLMYVPKQGRHSWQTALNFAHLQEPNPFVVHALVNSTMMQIKELENSNKQRD